ncbi:hypothetical protein ACFWF7_43655 [Nocardia sp. NPDC060256]|uniref:hypothetical protein n=1 Tax=unclassified Nocardia TaxID=2637762 RepID=UPI00364B4A3D
MVRMGQLDVRRRGAELRRGLSDEEIRRRYTGTDWHRLRWGAYVERLPYEELDGVDRHRTLVDAIVPTMADDAVVSHQSAAVIYGAPLWQAPLDRVMVTRNRRSGGRIKSDVKVHCAPMDAVVEVDGLLVTTPARTVVDLARTLPFESAVVTGDALVRDFGLSGVDLAAELEVAKSRRGIAAARRVVSFLDGHSESVGESRSRAMFARLGLPAPISQGIVFTSAHKVLGRVDFYFEGTGVLCEFDGRIKYGRLLRPGQEPGDAVFAEKIREDAMRACGFQLIRWTWQDLTTEHPATRIRAALARQRNTRADGYITQAPLPPPRPYVSKICTLTRDRH